MSISPMRGNSLYVANLKKTNTENLPFEMLSIRTLYFPDSNNTDTYMPSPHQHTFYELHLIIEGQQTYQFENETVVLDTDNMLIISPNVLHSIPERTAVMNKYALCFSYEPDARNKQSWLWTALDSRLFHVLKSTKTYKEMFEWMIDVLEQHSYGYEISVRCIAEAFIIHLANDVQHAQDGPVEHEEPLLAEKRVCLMERFIRDNLNLTISNDAIAGYVHLSVRQANRNTRLVRGLSLHEMTMRIRYQKACALLSETDRKILDICREIGFADESNFTRFFRSMKGESPSQYRKRTQGHSIHSSEDTLLS